MKTFMTYVGICVLGSISIFVVFCVPALIEEGLL